MILEQSARRREISNEELPKREPYAPTQSVRYRFISGEISEESEVSAES
jgi:hypothetical protein